MAVEKVDNSLQIVDDLRTFCSIRFRYVGRTEWLLAGPVSKTAPEKFPTEEDARRFLQRAYNENLLVRHPL